MQKWIFWSFVEKWVVGRLCVVSAIARTPTGMLPGLPISFGLATLLSFVLLLQHCKALCLILWYCYCFVSDIFQCSAPTYIVVGPLGFVTLSRYIQFIFFVHCDLYFTLSLCAYSIAKCFVYLATSLVFVLLGSLEHIWRISIVLCVSVDGILFSWFWDPKICSIRISSSCHLFFKVKFSAIKESALARLILSS